MIAVAAGPMAPTWDLMRARDVRSGRRSRFGRLEPPRQRVDMMIRRMQDTGLSVETPSPLPSEALRPRWMRWTPALARYAEYAREGVILAENVLEGWVVNSDEAGVVVEVESSDGVILRQSFSRKHLANEVAPEAGSAVRIIAHLVTAPDLELEPSIGDLESTLGDEPPYVELGAESQGEYYLPK